MPARRRPSKQHLRSTMDSVLLHDMRNMGFRLGLVLENLEEHFGDPDFKRSVVELLQGTREKLDTMVSRWTAHTDSILIKVEVDLNDIVREVLRVAHVRGPAGGTPPRVTAELAPLPRVWGDPHYLQDALLSLVQNALEAVAPSGRARRRALVRGAPGPEALRRRRDRRRRPRHERGVHARPPLPAFPDDEAGRSRARPLHEQPDPALPPGRPRREEPPGRGDPRARDPAVEDAS